MFDDFGDLSNVPRGHTGVKGRYINTRIQYTCNQPGLASSSISKTFTALFVVERSDKESDDLTPTLIS